MDGYRSKMVERIRLPDRAEREAAIEHAGYNVFSLASDEVYVDLLTDSGTGTMSDAQWAALLRGDEAYAGSSSFADLQAAVEDVTGFERVVPVHQGRGGENVLYGALLSEGDVVPNNTHFDTTRAHVANQGAEPVDCPVSGATDPDSDDPFKGNMDVDAVRALAEEVGAENVPAVILTVTNNSMAGQPVSVANARAVREVADELDATFVIDACRFAENAWFVTRREPGFADHPVAAAAREQLGLADALVMSGKKDGLVNVGGFVAVRDGATDAGGAGLFERCKQRAIMYEGFPTYGGMAGRDLAAMAVGLREAVEEPYVRGRIEQVQQLAAMLQEAGVPVYGPTGGHAVYVVADEALPHVPPERFPGQAFTVELYREGAVRAVELGSFAFPDGEAPEAGESGPAAAESGPAAGGVERPEFVRLALPRRTYHDEHLDHVAAAAGDVMARAEEVGGYEVVSEPPVPELRHFSARLEPV
jgi:tryptophanase